MFDTYFTTVLLLLLQAQVAKEKCQTLKSPTQLQLPTKLQLFLVKLTQHS